MAHMTHIKHEKLYKMLNDINRVSKKHINEKHEGYVLRNQKEYARKNNIECGIKQTFSTGTRTWKNFGIFDYEKQIEDYGEIKEEEKPNEELQKTLELELRLVQLEKEWSNK